MFIYTTQDIITEFIMEQAIKQTILGILQIFILHIFLDTLII